ncbi:aryl hydrocarbon receptor-like isoform 1-T3 [Aulostomus maculatus]
MPSDTTLGNSGTYANKKRKKPVLKQKKVHDGNDIIKSNPSKRHRDRLNGELDRLTNLLPFSEDIRSCLDKLSVLRLSVGYLRAKSYFKATMNNSNSRPVFPGVNRQNQNSLDTTGFSEGDLLLQALNGFVLVVTSEGLVFYASPTIKDYLGFQQSDVVHQSVFELIHTDDRAMFKQQLHFALNSPDTDGDCLEACMNTEMYNPEHLPPENSSFLERGFVCRFRCLLDNSSGFLSLKFQGKLKYLHGQSVLRDNGAHPKSSLALFAIAMPVAPPSILEIRSKMLLFQSKHKLDFTPTGIDNRGKIILGYSDVELCMKGSGYQFIHAADMMYCADKHLRMIKTGESGLTVFRLLSKSNNWVWVKSNAKLIYKGGRPEFIIAYQTALAKAEGEEYLRQRRLELPFSLTTGEALLYNTGPTVDIAESQFNKMFNNNDTDMNKDVPPGCLLDCFLRQDESAYTQSVDTPLAVDQVFMDSRALVSIPSDVWWDDCVEAPTEDPVVVKEETKQSVTSVINSLEEIAQNGDFNATLRNLDADADLMEWAESPKRLNVLIDSDKQSSVRTELDCILTNEIFDYIDSVLFKEKGEDCLKASPPSCLTAVNNNQHNAFSQEVQLPLSGLCQQQLFQTPMLDQTSSQINGLYSQQQDANKQVNIGQSEAGQALILRSTQKLSHHGALRAQANTHPPSHQQLALQDIFSPSIELPELTVPSNSTDEVPVTFEGYGLVPISNMGCPQGLPGNLQYRQLPLCPQNNMQAPAGITNRQLLQSSVQQPSNVSPALVDILPPLIPCNELNSYNKSNIPIPFSTVCHQASTHFQTHNQNQLQQWPQSQYKLHHAGLIQNTQEPMQGCHSQTSESQTFPNAGLWQGSVNGLDHTQQGGQACGQAATPSSCMFNQDFSSSPAGGATLAHSGPSCQRGANVTLDQSPPQGSCYFQWGHSEDVVGTSTINQENTTISPMTVLPNMSSSEHSLGLQNYLG